MPRQHLSIWRERNFDREAIYVVAKDFRFNGDLLLAGQAFEKTSCSVRRLRQLYEHRKIEFESGPMPIASPGRPLRSIAERNKALVAERSGKIVEPKTSRPRPKPEPDLVPVDKYDFDEMKLKNFGHGDWAVIDASGARISPFMKRALAQKRLLELSK